MANIGTFNNQEGAVFNDNSLTLNATKSETQVNVQPQMPGSKACDDASKDAMPQPQEAVCHDLKFAGNKTDLARILCAAYFKRCFQHEDGTFATQEEIFAAFDKSFKVGLKDYSQLLNNIRNTKPETNAKIFEELEEICRKYAAEELSAQ